MDILFDDITLQTMADLEKIQKEFWNIPRQVGIFLNTLIKTSNSKNVLAFFAGMRYDRKCTINIWYWRFFSYGTLSVYRSS